ncbi:hypothetical protein HU200_060476 [Digitaria exilis]|uniref:AP2/ERF domain-containing protein n=1 Tax=Digitaria exilis TaxID=1010633 RepID=A0A835AEN1_9POAL|nr:hypothetical protein HU200_060476 [Digitaria exilis]
MEGRNQNNRGLGQRGRRWVWQKRWLWQSKRKKNSYRENHGGFRTGWSGARFKELEEEAERLTKQPARHTNHHSHPLLAMAPRLERDGGFHFPNSEQENSLFLRTIISVMFGDTAVLALVPETAMAPAPAPAVACARCDADAAAATGSSSNSEEHGGECSGSATRVVTGPEAAWASGEEGEQLQVTGACGGGRGAMARHLRHNQGRAYNIAAVAFRGHRANPNFLTEAAAPASSWAPTTTMYQHNHLLPQPLLECLHEKCGSNAVSPVHAAQLEAAAKPPPRVRGSVFGSGSGRVEDK